ncbi:MAG: AAA family ATPase [Archaeoglobaceae archaeon]
MAFFIIGIQFQGVFVFKKDDVTLTVKEAFFRDVGRGIARIDPEVMSNLNLEDGNIIEITGIKSVPGIAWSSYPEDKGTKIIRIDGGFRDNARTSIDGKVVIRRADANKAEKIKLAPSEPVRLLGGKSYMLKLLEGRPLKTGQKIRVEVFGHTLTFNVVSTKPSGVVVVSRNTDIELKEQPEEVEEESEGIAKIAHLHHTKSYADIGGLSEAVNSLREIIEISIIYPKISQKLNIDIEPPRGVLLHGLSGTGKTLTMKAIANELDIFILAFSAPEIMSRYVGETELRLRETFEEAKNYAPTIIYISEFEALAPRREDAGELERRIVSQLMSIMDEIENGENIILIAETNKPDLIEPALLRPGRIENYIYFPMPNKEEREEIFRTQLKGMPLDEGLDIEELANKTENYTGAGIKAICRKAGILALKRATFQEGLKSLSEFNKLGEIPISNLKLTMKDFEDSIRSIKTCFTEEEIQRYQEMAEGLRILN